MTSTPQTPEPVQTGPIQIDALQEDVTPANTVPADQVSEFRFPLKGTINAKNLSIALTQSNDVLVSQKTLQRIDIRLPRVKWTFDPGHDFFGSDADTSPPFVLSEDTVFVAGEGNLFAVDLETGELRWRVAIGLRIRGTFLQAPVYVPADDGRPAQVVTADAEGLMVSVDPSTGRPLVTNGSLLGGNIAILISFDPGTARNAAEGTDIGPGVIFAAGVYSGSGSTPKATLVALDAGTFETRWQAAEAQKFFFSEPTVGNGSLFMARDTAEGFELQRYPLDALGFAPAATTPIAPTLGARGLVQLTPQDGIVYYSSGTSGLGLVSDGEPAQVVGFGGDMGLAGPVLYTNRLGSRRALLAGGLPPTKNAFYVVVALPIGSSPNFVETEVDNTNAVGKLVVNENLFGVTYIQPDNGPGTLIGIDLTTV